MVRDCVGANGMSAVARWLAGGGRGGTRVDAAREAGKAEEERSQFSVRFIQNGSHQMEIKVCIYSADTGARYLCTLLFL